MIRSMLVVALLSLLGCHQTDFDPSLAPPPVASAPSVDAQPVTLCDANEPGERMVFSGRVLDYTGKPLWKAAVMAYHADAKGLYNPPNTTPRTPRLRNVAITEKDGGFRFSTIRPAAYPDASEPAHIHLGVIAPAHHLRYVTYWFDGDPLITAERRRKAATDP